MQLFRISIAFLCLLAGIQTSAAQSKPTSGEAIRERAIVRYKGIPQENAEAMANVADTVSRFYRDEFGLRLPERTIIRAELARNNRPGILAQGREEISLQYNRSDQLKSPNKSSAYTVYAIAYELAEMARKQTIGDAKWMTSDAADGLSYYLASEAIDRLNFVYNRSLWPDAFDYGGEGIQRLEQALRNRNGPDMVQAAGFWFDLAKLQGKSSIRGVLSALTRVHDEKLDASKVLRELPGAQDAMGKSRLDRWLRKFERTLFADRQRKSPANSKVTLAKDPIILKYDDDRGSLVDVASDAAPAVFFSLPAGKWYITEVQFHGLFDAKVGGSVMPTLRLCDRDMKFIDNWPVPSGSLRGTSARWRTVSVKPTLAPQEFVILLQPALTSVDNSAGSASKGSQSGTSKESSTSQPSDEAGRFTGLRISVDDSSKGHSALVNAGTSARPFERGDWMMRVKLDTARNANPLLWRP